MSADLLEIYIETGDTENLKMLLMQNPKFSSVKTASGVSPLMLSCYYRKPQITAILLEFVPSLTLHEAAASGQIDQVMHLVFTHPDKTDSFSEDGFTPLGLACYFGHEKIVRYLLQKGANPNLPSDNGFRVFPIHSAVSGNYFEITLLLIDNKAEVNVAQQSGVMPLHSAAQNGNVDILILLLEHGAQTNIRMEGGKLPADLAREKGYLDIASILE